MVDEKTLGYLGLLYRRGKEYLLKMRGGVFYF